MKCSVQGRREVREEMEIVWKCESVQVCSEIQVIRYTIVFAHEHVNTDQCGSVEVCKCAA